MTQGNYFYVLVRTDLPIEQQMCQAIHAAHESGIHLANKSKDISSVVVCAVPNEAKLQEVYIKLKSRGIKTVMFLEPDIGNQATALATEPICGDQRKIFANFKLWR